MYLSGLSFFLVISTSVVGSEAENSTSFNPNPQNTTVAEGGTATFTCRPEVNGVLGLALWALAPPGGTLASVSRQNTSVFPGVSGAFLSRDRTTLFLVDVQESIDGATIECEGTDASASLARVPAGNVYLTVGRIPRFNLSTPSLLSVVEGGPLNISIQIIDQGKPVGAFSLIFSGKSLGEDNGLTVTRESTTATIVVSSVHRNDSGNHEVRFNNVLGNDTAAFTLDVLYPPQFSEPERRRRQQLMIRESFEFNCTPSDANPSTISYSFNRNGTSHLMDISVLTISSVVRGDSGNYSCTATNSAGSTTVYYGLLVVAPPTEPRTVIVSQVTPFSSTISWTPPTDNGGISSPSWIPPSPDSSMGLTYHVTYDNSSGSWTSTVNSTQSMLIYLQHSTDYTVSVVAENVYGRSAPSGEVMLRTSDSKPIIDRVSLMVLSLTNFTANITFLTIGGQTVTSFKIMVNGLMRTDTTQVTDGKLKTVSLVVDGLSLTKGTDYSVSVTATNSIGESEPVMGTLTVPNPPNITSPPTELPPNSTSPCCSGVKLNLARPQDVSDVRVSLSVNGGPYEMVRSGDLTLSGDILYISGLQAGSVYTANITVSNIFGSTEQQTTLKPLLGRPSNPAKPLVAVDSTSVTFALSTDYPGTERTRSGSKFTFQVHFNKIGCSTRQSVLDKVDVSPLSLNGASANYRGVLEPGSYTVSVIAVNEHGNSSSVMSEQFSVQAPCTGEPQAGVDSITIVYIIIIVVLFILLVVATVYSVVVTVKLRRVSGVLSKQKVGGNKLEPVYDEMGMEPRPSKNEIIIDKNPAYDSVDVGKPTTAAAVEYEEVGDSRHGIRTEKGTKL